MPAAACLSHDVIDPESTLSQPYACRYFADGGEYQALDGLASLART